VFDTADLTAVEQLVLSTSGEPEHRTAGRRRRSPGVSGYRRSAVSTGLFRTPTVGARSGVTSGHRPAEEPTYCASGMD
jgi:hypothetical protein